MIPKLRFPEFTDNWVERKLGDVMSITSAARVHKEEWSKSGVPFFRSSDVVSAFKGTKNNKAFIPFELYESLTKKIGRVKKGDLLVTGGGSIGVPYLIENNDLLYFKDADLLWLKSNNKISGYFLYTFFSTPLFRKYLQSITHEGTIAHYTVIQAKNTPCRLPQSSEQQKIASFLRVVDKKINLLTKKKKALETYKKGLMQKIFSQELRFKREDGTDYPEWERLELIDVLDYKQPTKYIVDSTEYSNDYKTPVLTAGKSFILGYTDEEHNHFTNFPVVIFDDFTTDFKYVDFAFKVKSSAMKILIPRENVNVRFVYDAMKTIRFPKGEHKRYWISEYGFMKIPYPSEEEQQRIASLSVKFDQKIDVVDRELSSIRKLKKGLLQQMFV